jgi:hypothetical protein
MVPAATFPPREVMLPAAAILMGPAAVLTAAKVISPLSFRDKPA